MENNSDSGKNSSVDWRTIVVSNALTFIVTVLASITIYYYTIEKPQLNYELFPLSSFISNENKISIINAKIINSGSKEAEEVTCIFKLKENVIIKEANVDLSSPGIKYTSSSDSLRNIIKYEFPTLNSKEQCNFSFLLTSRSDSLKTSDIEISLRGKGVNGTVVNVNNQINTGFTYKKVLSIIALTIVYIILVLGSWKFITKKYVIYKRTPNRNPPKETPNSINLNLQPEKKNEVEVNFREVKLNETENIGKSNKDREDISVLINEAVSFCDRGHFNYSISLLKKAIDIDPNRSSTYCNLARAYANKGDYKNAFTELEKGHKRLSQQNDFLIYFYTSAQVNCLFGNLEKASSLLVEAYKLDPERVKQKAIRDKDFEALRQHNILDTIFK